MPEQVKEIMVEQWSFHKECHGQGCSKCNRRGTVVKLIPIASLGRDARYQYEKEQADFIRQQKLQMDEVKS